MLPTLKPHPAIWRKQNAAPCSRVLRNTLKRSTKGGHSRAHRHWRSQNSALQRLTSFGQLKYNRRACKQAPACLGCYGETTLSRRLPKRVGTAGGISNAAEFPGGELRQQILKTAIRLFAQKGFRGTTTREIALAAGVNEVTIFRNFASKQDLYTAILEVKSSEAGITTWVAELGQFAERRDDAGLFLFVARNILAHYRRDSDFLSLKLYSTLEGHELAQKYRERQICPLFRFLRDYISKRQRERAFRRCNPDIAVQAFLGSIYNHATCLHFSEVDFIKLTEEETAKEFTEIFLRGMRREPGGKRATRVALAS